jgi:glycosyltransferase involved in cell wall biosynthesis
MRILFITDNFPPEVNAPATRTYEHCRQWAEQGMDITVLTCVPNFPHGKVYPGYHNRIYQKERMDGIRVVRLWSYMTANQGFAKRIIDYLSFAVNAFLFGLYYKADIIVATSPQFFTTWAACGISFLKRIPWVFELRDLWPESIKTVGAMENSRALRFLEKAELFLYHRSDLVVALTPAFKKNIVARGIPAEKVATVPNGANLNLFQPRPKDSQLLRKLGLEDKFVVGYLGTHGMAHSLEFIVSTLDKIENKAIHFLFIGDGARKKYVVKKARDKGLKNVTFLDPVPKEDVPRYLSLMDASLVPLKKSDTFKTVIPSKIFESACMSRPIILGVDGQAREIIEYYGAGIFFEPEDESAFLIAVNEIISDQALYSRLQTGCRELAMAYDRKQLADDMLACLSGIACRNSPILQKRPTGI